MRFEHQGMCLWYGAPDAPAPSETVPTSTEIPITVAVQPADASNRVEVLYRRNRGPTETAPARWVRNDPSGKTQYYRASLPALEAGDTLEYTPICRCVGRQVPSPEEAQEFASSLHAAGTTIGAEIGSVREATAPTEEPVPVEAEIEPERVVPAPAYEPKPLEADKVIEELLETSAVAATEELRNVFIGLHARHEGPTEDFWSELRESPQLSEPGMVADLQFTLQLGALTENNLPLVRALQGLRREGTLQQPRDLAKLDTNAWRSLIENGPQGQPIEIPAGVPGETRPEKVTNYVGDLIAAVEETFPTAFIGMNLAKDPQIEPALLNQVLSQNPRLDPGEPLLEDLDWSGVEAADQPKAKADMETLRREIRMFPEFDYHSALATSNGAVNLTNPIRQGVARILENAPELDLGNTRIDAYLGEHGQIAFAGVDERYRPAVTKQLKRLQRVFKVAPKSAHIEALMGEGLDSALRISEQSRGAFVEQFATQVGGGERAAEIFRKAELVTGTLQHVYTGVYQALNDVTPAVMGGTEDLTKEIDNWSTLFGRLDFCDCEHCRSVYSPAAYFVDLLQFLNPKVPRGGSGRKPLEVLREHRPDLEHIKLTCENTNTPIPYADLVNEVLESYIALGTLDESVARNTENITAAELDVNPQYTSEEAYGRLEQAVFPLSLPFHKPLEVARTYLEHLGSSRHQVMETFRTNGVPSDLDLASEYLTLSPRERAIVTGTGTVPTETIWVDERLPEGAVPGPTGTFPWGTGDSWKWDGVNPAPFSGARAHLSDPVAGMHQHYFNGATDPLAIEPGDTLFAYVYLDPISVPSEVMLQWVAGGKDWEHRAYWGANHIALGTEGTASRRHMGALPGTGGWVRLEVPADQVGLEGKALSGMAFVLHGGRAAWDRAGKRSGNAKLREFYGYDEDTVEGKTWQQHLAQVPEFLRRTDLHYTDLLELLKTKFMNPNPTSAAAVTLNSHGEDCDLGATTLNNLAANDNAALKKAHCFIRLWRRLGGSMSDLDGALSVLGTGDIDESFLTGLAEARRLQAELKTPFVQLLNLWMEKIDTRGDNSLYRTLFQNKAVLHPLDPAFDLRPDGTQLASTAARVSDKIPAILAALRINTAELAAIRRADAAGIGANAALNLENLSKLHRYALLARALKLPIRDLISLKTLSGIDPFWPNDPKATAAFVGKVEKVRRSGFTVAQLNYLYRNISDPTSGPAPLREHIASLVKNLQAGLRKITEETAVVPDPTGELLRSKLPMAMDVELVNAAIALFEGSAVYAAALDSLPNITFPNQLASRISYDGDATELRFVGAMSSAEHTTLWNLSQNEAYRLALEDLFRQPRSFISDSLSNFIDDTNAAALLVEDASASTEEKFAYVLTRLMAYVRDTLSRSLIQQVLSEDLSLDVAVIEQLLEKVLKAYSEAGKPAMQDFLALAGNGVGDGLSATYFDGPNLTNARAQRVDPTIDFTWKNVSPAPGIAPFSFGVRWTGKILAPRTETYTFRVYADNGVKLWVDNQLLIDQWHEQKFKEHSGEIALQEGRLYDIEMNYYHTDPGPQDPDGDPNELALAGSPDRGSERDELTTSVASPLGSAARARLYWSSSSTLNEVIPQSHLFSGDELAPFRKTLKSYYLLHKIALLINVFGMRPEEAGYLSTNGGAFGGLDLNLLPVSDRADQGQAGAIDAQAPALFKQWERLYDLFELRDSLPHGEVGLIDVFRAAGAAGTNLGPVLDMLAAATGWDRTELDDASGTNGLKLGADDFKNEIKLRMLQRCLALNRRLGTSARQLFTWATGEPDANQARDIINTVKAKYDDAQWLAVGKPLNDGLRERQKAALISYVLADKKILEQGITDSNQLFEYFLIDVDMSACMKTSRIKQAISSVQLFVQHCLMNLEPQVAPYAIDADRWKWMKNYRVWEANRKVFLYPEIWIEPELRDDKSPFFKELETELLQNEVTADTVETAFLNYLEKLDDVARLEICGMYRYEETIGQDTTDVLHVFGRTFASPHLYYYRTFVDGITWTPWEKVNLDIEGDHLIPVAYNRRFYLFWPIFERKADPKADPPPQQGKAPKEHWEIKLAWSEYKNGKWAPKKVSSDYLPSPEPVAGALPDIPGKETYTFKAFAKADALSIQCYRLKEV